jgi:membrane protease subunit (stomatin/prohibitin family)
MEIPESISNMTEEGVADRFAVLSNQQQVSFDDISHILRQKLDLQSYKSFEEGLIFYKKETVSDKNIIKNLLLLYIDTLTKNVQTSEIKDEYKSELIKALNTSINSAIQNIDSMHSLLNYFNKEKNILDVQRISYIILGYAIDTIKRINITKR